MSVSPTLSQYLESPYPQPIFKRLPLKFTNPMEAYERLAHSPYAFLLESVKGSAAIGRYSFVGSEPFLVFKSKGTRVEIQNGEKKEVLENQNPLTILRDLIKRFAMPRPKGVPPFFGGAVGFFGYEFVHFIEDVSRAPMDDLNCPDLCLIFIDTLVAFDHEENELWLIHCPSGDRFYHEDRQNLYSAALERLALLEDRLFQPALPRSHPPKLKRVKKPSSSVTKDQFMKMVRTCKEYIEAGDIYQANLSQRFMFDADIDSWQLYGTLRHINPAPFSGYLLLDDLCLVSSSPERLVRLQDGRVETRPIAGTRPRGETPSVEENMRKHLLTNEKERAEHIMLVDLERNDLGRVCRYGTVKVNELMTVEQYSHVIHIVSNIQGVLADGRDGLDVIRAVFPGGTITGVPKVRCMEIISELEPVGRGPYTGSLGYISYSEEMDFNILIRTFVISQGKISVQVGAGIVADSDPEQEFQETLYKAEALMAALQALP